MTERIERTVTSLSWIPSEAIDGLTRLSFDAGISHYDLPPPDSIDSIEDLRKADRFRFANELRAWIELDGGTVVASGYVGGGRIGATTVRLGRFDMTFAAVALPDQQEVPAVDGTSVTFVQTAGGRTGLPMPRKVKHPPYVQFNAPLAWTTLALTIHADGSCAHELRGASPFPRHWIYDARGRLATKSGLVDFKEWSGRAFGARTPWGGQNSAALVTEVETALERELSRHIMRRDTKPGIRLVPEGRTLVEQGEPGDELFLLLDGVLDVDVDGTVVAQMGPGAVFGERAVLEGGTRSATLRAATACRVATAKGDQIAAAHLDALAAQHRREKKASAGG